MMDIDPSADTGQVSGSFTLKSEEFEQGDFGEPPVKHEEDEDLKREMEMKQDKKDPEAITNNLDSLLILLASAGGYNVVADSPGGNGIEMGWPSKIPVEAALKFISMGYSYNWWKQGSTLEFRDRYWFRKRALQIPEAWLERWRETFKKTGTLEIDDLADMGALTGDWKRYEVNICGDKILDNASVKEAVCSNAGVLRFFDLLNQTQRSEVFEKAGLRLEALSPDQWQYLETLVSGLKQEPEVVFKGSWKKGYQDRTEYTFSTTGKQWWFRSPKYEEPKKSEAGRGLGGEVRFSPGFDIPTAILTSPRLPPPLSWEERG